ncbi:MAG TPA: alpha/beta hydrolase-fold protein [Aliidongia sp.]|uniref:alpha/beta hydrolase n=1 Tax=Aliidongia sp. TaxID=1914230 RepID=UPI002DDD1BD2|nr:alpha/beta hydrolase-fold protein [Aliidongia sp.]HEV2674440.1 alpha/beta hydrolase-fold protein [Aliidongia sp.]
MHKDRAVARGTIHPLTVASQALAGNLLGDPTERAVPVYVPAGHDGSGLPLLVDIVGFTGGGPSHVNWKNFGENVPERLDRLIATGAMPPVVVAFPDCFTRLGGNQYVNSAAMGRWEDFLIDEMLPAVEDRFRCGGPGRRGLFGKSSGGYGAIVHALRHADIWAAAACHSGDMGFDLCYLGDLFESIRHLGKHDRSIEKFIAHFEAAPKPADADVKVLMILAMAATYDPDPSQFLGIRLPVDLATGERIAERWANWLAWDPVNLADEFGENLRGLKALYIDCGTDDQYNLVFGARQLHRKLERRGILHRYEEFPDNHSSIDYRMDESLPFLAQALTA